MTRARVIEAVLGAVLLSAAAWIAVNRLRPIDVEYWNRLFFGLTVVRILLIALLALAGLMLISLAALPAGWLRAVLKKSYRVLTVIGLSSFVLLEIGGALFPSVFEPLDRAVFRHDVRQMIPDPELGYRYAQTAQILDGTFVPGVQGDLVEAGQTPPDPEADGGAIPFRRIVDANGRVPEWADVVVLGDSYAASLVVEPNDRWVNILKERIRPAVVYSLAIPGYGPQQYLAALKKYGLKLKPKLVIWCHYEGNDLWDAELWEKGRKRRSTSASRPFLYRLTTVKVAGYLFKTLAGAWTSKPKDRPVRGINPVPYTLGGRDYQQAFGPVFFERLGHPMERLRSYRGWTITRAMLEEARALCAQRNITFLVAYCSSPTRHLWPYTRDAIDSDRLYRYVRQYINPAQRNAGEMRSGLDRYRQVQEGLFHSFCSERGIDWFSCSAVLEQALRDGTRIFYSYDTHMNAAGNRIFAESLSRFIRERYGKILP